MTTDSSPRPSALRRMHISLRQLFLLVAWVAVGCAALKTANNFYWALLSAVLILLYMAMAVIAAIDRADRQAFAWGFLICTSIYVLLIVANPHPNSQHSREFDPYDGDLPTTRLLLPLFEAMVKRTEVPTASLFGQAGLVMPAGSIQPYPTTTWSEEPNRTTFMRVAHAFWALLVGYAGGRFARWTYDRRVTVISENR